LFLNGWSLIFVEKKYCLSNLLYYSTRFPRNTKKEHLKERNISPNIGLFNLQFYPAVHGSKVFGTVACKEVTGTKALSCNSPGSNPSFYQIVPNGICTFLGNLQIVLGITFGIGITTDFN
jgi:hypothetical protein